MDFTVTDKNLECCISKRGLSPFLFLAGCDVLLTTDDRFLKRSSSQLTILDPIEFVKRLEATP